MFINLNYSLSTLLHILILFFLFFTLKTERQPKMYNEVININLSTLKTFETENTLEKDNFAPVKKIDSKNQANNNKKNLSKSKIINKEAKIKNISSFKEQKEEEENIKNNYQIEKNFEDIESKTVSQQQNLKKKNTSANTIADENRNIFNNYNDELKALIQRNATQNYPRISLRKKEEGIVELNFSIDINGNILNITAGKKTNAPQRLITASINTLKLISPYKKNPILKKKNTFSIIIVYKLK
ncbi:MAG: hypothetical protein CMJ06_04035 [Pelagibacterales bacterium]|nr:hypothetical protein [Pelagibacterales bacterium]OUU62085.1 MAG: hypothetical protein CBC22_05485 [Alphaproteobacteria bacterium TMED62]